MQEVKETKRQEIVFFCYLNLNNIADIVEFEVKFIVHSHDEKTAETEGLAKESKDNRSKIKKFLLYGKSFLPFFLSHHPECESFKGHTLNFGKVKALHWMFHRLSNVLYNAFINKSI